MPGFLTFSDLSLMGAQASGAEPQGLSLGAEGTRGQGWVAVGVVRVQGLFLNSGWACVSWVFKVRIVCESPHL